MVRLRTNLTEAELERGFDEPYDLFSRKPLASSLTALFKSLESGSVCLLDGRWGVGKSTFVKQWRSELRKENIPSIYFDAFSSDHLDSPFEAVASAFVIAASDARKTDDPVYKTFLSKAASVGRVVGTTAAKVGIKAVTLGLIGAAELEALEEVKDTISEGSGELADKAFEKILHDSSNNKRRFDELRNALADLPGLLKPNPSSDTTPPLIVFIDELDRCRPDFALGILETLKHFFRVTNIHFVLVTNRDHIELSVAHRYGYGENAREYLEKFYDFTVFFEQTNDRHGRSGAVPFVRHIANRLLPNETSDIRDVIDYLEEITGAFDLSLRQVESLTINVSLSFLAAREREFRPAMLVTLLCAIKLLDPELYRLAKLKQFDLERFRTFLRKGRWEKDLRERIETIFQYHSDPNIDANSEEWRIWGSGLSRYNLGRTSVIPYLANSIIDRFAAPSQT